MKKKLVSFCVMLFCMMSLLDSINAFAETKKWNNLEAKNRYNERRKEAIKAYGEESKAWKNYDRELERAQDDVRRVRNNAIKGAVKGGAPGAALGAAKGAGKSIYERGKHYYKERKRK